MWVVNEPEGKLAWRTFWNLAFKGTQQLNARLQSGKVLLDRLDELAEQIQTASSAHRSELPSCKPVRAGGSQGRIR